MRGSPRCAAVRDGIDRASSCVDVALTPAPRIGKILQVQLKAKAVAAQAEDLSHGTARSLPGRLRRAALDQINQIANSATFNGANLVDNRRPDAQRVLQSDLDTGVGAGNVATVAGGAKPATAVTPSRSDLMINASEAWAAANDMVANDFVVFTQLGNTYAVQVTATMTVQQFIDGVNAADRRPVIASYNDATGVLSYQATGPVATAPFSVDIDTNATATGTAHISTFVNGNAAATTVAATDRPSRARVRPRRSPTSTSRSAAQARSTPCSTAQPAGGPNAIGAHQAVRPSTDRDDGRSTPAGHAWARSRRRSTSRTSFLVDPVGHGREGHRQPGRRRPRQGKRPASSRCRSSSSSAPRRSRSPTRRRRSSCRCSAAKR